VDIFAYSVVLGFKSLLTILLVADAIIHAQRYLLDVGCIISFLPASFAGTDGIVKTKKRVRGPAKRID
jgi:hypothetical protein